MSIRQCIEVPSRLKDLTGKTIDNWVVLGFVGYNKHSQPVWLCRCVCGTTKPVCGTNLGRSYGGGSKSCGCLLRKSSLRRTSGRHGLSSHPLYKLWSNILYRCYSPGCRQYRHYGATGVTVCERWTCPDGFVHFLEDMGPRPSPEHSVDRIGGAKIYSKETCRWATDTEQNRNKRTNVLFEHDGRTQTMSAWAEEFGINYATMKGRIRRGMSIQEIMETPIRGKTKETAIQQRTDAG